MRILAFDTATRATAAALWDSEAGDDGLQARDDPAPGERPRHAACLLPSIVTSPTFTIGQRYRAPIPVSHVDLFRVDDLGGEDPDLLDDYLRPDTIAFVEWPQGAEAALAELGEIVARVKLEHAGADNRVVVIG